MRTRIPAAATAEQTPIARVPARPRARTIKRGDATTASGDASLKEFEVVHGFNQRIVSTAGMMRSSRNFG